MMSEIVPGSDAWLDQIQEDIVDPQRPIIDPHHHLWKKRFGRNYLLEDLWQDTGAGHKVLKTVFIECSAFYLREGPEHMRPLGETRYVTEQAERSRQQPGNAQVAGIVAHANLTLGHEPEKLREILDAHQAQCRGLLRGIRHATAKDPRPEDLLIALPTSPYMYGREDFRAGVRLLAEYGLSYDAWHYHHQNEDFCEFAEAIPETTMILDHLGTPLGVGIYQGASDTIFSKWKDDMRRLARCPNVYVKLGGMAMPDNGFGWDKAQRPASSDEIVRRQKKYYLHMIDCFGPERCMFESNFPVDRLSVSYTVIWNAFKKMTSDFTEDEKHAMFYGTAERIYRLE